MKFEELTEREKEILASAFLCGFEVGDTAGYVDAQDQWDGSADEKEVYAYYRLRQIIHTFEENNSEICNNKWTDVVKDMLGL